MSELQKKGSAVAFIDYVPAELRENKTWEIVYYCKNPFTGKLKIKRNRVRPLKSIVERRKHGKRMVLNINRKLENGWNPWVEQSRGIRFIGLFEAMDRYLMIVKKELEKDDKRDDTLRTYSSYIRNIKKYLTETNREDIYVYAFTKELTIEFLDHIYYERDNKARTRNNYLGFIFTLFGFFMKKKYVGNNPAQDIDALPNNEKKRIYIPSKYRKIIFDYFEKNNPEYLVLSLLCYYCLVRRTEITKLKVGDIFLKNGILYVEGGVAKNRKSKPVTIPDKLLPMLANHIKKAANEDYIFSHNLHPGSKRLKPKKISDIWAAMRKDTKLPTSVQWYGLKDSGITDLLKRGVKPILVKDQARHYSISQTMDYYPKEIIEAETSIKTLGLDF
ncbi:MAG: tyrosine-type recombinase/integrase [Flavobacteriaceae bacterium]